MRLVLLLPIIWIIGLIALMCGAGSKLSERALNWVLLAHFALFVVIQVLRRRGVF